MSRLPTSFLQSDVTRAVRGARSAGLDVTGVKITRDGAITVQIGKLEQVTANGQAEGSPWDEVLAHGER